MTGNPLCVFENGSGLTTEAMQALARQFNLSETTFILPSSRAAARVRIFTPTYEMPFAGHPTLGTAHVCRALKLGGDALVLEMQAGLIPVRAQGDRWTLTAVSATWRELDASRAELAEALGLKEARHRRAALMGEGRQGAVGGAADLDRMRCGATAPVTQRLQSIRSEDDQSMAYVFASTATRQRVGAILFSARRRNTRGSGHRVRDRQFRRLVLGDEAAIAGANADFAGRDRGPAFRLSIST